MKVARAGLGVLKRAIAVVVLVSLLALGVMNFGHAVSASSGKVSLNPDPVLLLEGQSQAISVTLDEPIVVPVEEGEGYVTVNLVSSNPSVLSVSTSSVTYSAAEWAQTKTFSITAEIDDAVTGNQDVTISFEVDSNAEYYDTYTGQIDVTFVDRELSGLFAAGSGSQEDPYKITDCVQLQAVGSEPEISDAFYELINPIDCNDTTNWNGGQGWAPLASFTNRFSGELNGNNFEISNLFLHREPAPGLGIFSYTENATFKNLVIGGSVRNSTEHLGTCSGGLAAIAFGSVTVENVVSTVAVSGLQDTIGGLVGCIINGDGNSTIVDSTVDAQLSLGAIGGLIGDASMSGAASLTIENSTSAGEFSGVEAGGVLRVFTYDEWDTETSGPALSVFDTGSSAEITATGITAGLITELRLEHRWATVEDSFYTGSAEASGGGSVAGLVNSMQSLNDDPAETIITGSYVSSSLVSAAGSVGGLVGVVAADHGVSIAESYFGGVITASGDRVGGIVGHSEGYSVIDDSYADAQIDGQDRIGGLIGEGTAEINHSFAFGSISNQGSQHGGLAGALSDGLIDNSFAAVSIASTMPTTTGGLVGVVSDVTVTSGYVDADINSQGCVSTASFDDTSTIDCTTVNEDGSEPAYFYNNTANPPLDSWNFEGIWQTNEYFYPCFQWQEYCQTFEPQMLCEQPHATPTTIVGLCDIQVRSGYDYGSTTWEARYKKAGDTEYLPVVLEDETVAGATIVGLLPDTVYYLEFKFTNNWGTGEWARLEYFTPANPEVNIDMSSAEDQSRINFVASGCELMGEWQTQKESSLAVTDAAYSYPKGLVAFNLIFCPLGGTATVRVTFTTDLDPSAVGLRKYNADIRSFTQLSYSRHNLVLGRSTLDGKAAITAEYTVTDGGELDQDGLVNGQILDPVGLSVLQVASPNTGLQRRAIQ